MRYIPLFLLLFALPCYAVDTVQIDRDGVTTPVVLNAANIGAASVVNLTKTCVGDGVANDAACFQTALTGLGAGQTLDGGGKTYLLSGSVTSNTAGVTIRNLTFSRNTNGTLITINGAKTTLDNVNNTQNFPTNTGGSEISFGTTATGSVLQNSKLYNNGIGRVVAVSADDMKIRNNEIYGTNSSSVPNIGIWCDHGDSSTTIRISGLIVEGNTFKNHGINAIYGKAYNAKVIGNTFSNNHLQTTPTGGGQINILDKNLTKSLSSWVISGNTFTDGGGTESYGVESDASNVTISGNYFLNNVGSTGIILQTSGIINNTVVGNTIAGNRDGVVVNPGISEFDIKGNTIINNTRYGIWVNTGSSDNYQIFGNRFKGNTAADILDGGTGIKKVVQSAANSSALPMLAASVSCSAGSHVSAYDPSTGAFTCSADSTTGGETDTNAVHVNTAGEIAAIATKATPVSGDYVLIEDSAASNAKKKITIGSLPLGSVTSVTSANTDISVSNGTTAPQLTLNSGEGANQIPKLNGDGGLSLNGSDWVSGTGTVTATSTAILTANTAGAFSVLKSGASIKLSSNVVVEVLSITDDSHLVLNSNASVAGLTWSYKNPSIIIKSNGGDIGYLKGSGALGLKGDGNAMPKVYLHAWGGNPQLLGMRSNGTLASQTNIAANDVLLAIAAGGYNGTWSIGGNIQIKASEAWTGSATGTSIVFNTTPNGTFTSAAAMQVHGSKGVSIGSTIDPGAGNLSVTGTFIAGYTALTDASATISTDTTRLTVTSTTARTLTLPKTLPVGTSTANLTVVASGAAASVTFAAETGGSISWGDAGAPATSGTVASGKRQRFTCVSENSAATTTAAWDCYQAGGTF